MPPIILTINAGSSSIKFAVFDNGAERPAAVRGIVESIASKPRFVARDKEGRPLAERDWPRGASFDALLQYILSWVEEHLDDGRLAGVGHRVVHGGCNHIKPERVNAALIKAFDRLAPLAPLHEAHNLAPIRAVARLRPDLPQVACFDTAFHHTMPPVARRFGLPRELENAGIRRYGFHGLSYEYIAGKLRETAPSIASGRVIAAHLGNGASLCAMANGQSIDTTMGFTTLDGLVMGTRCGNLDPGVILFLQQERGLTAGEVADMLYRRSGLLGVSGGIASDMRTLIASDDRRAAEAVELFVFRIAREIGALTSSLGGLDGVVFTAGIGENAAPVRKAVLARLGWLGVEPDDAANEKHAAIITAPQSRVEVRVMPTDEEAIIARHTEQTIGP